MGYKYDLNKCQWVAEHMYTPPKIPFSTLVRLMKEGAEDTVGKSELGE